MAVAEDPLIAGARVVTTSMRSLVLAVLAVAGACYRDAPPRGAAAPPPAPAARAARFAADPLAFLSVDAEIVARVDVVQLRRSATWQRLEPRLLATIAGPLELFRTTCGFDPIGSLRSIVIAVGKVDTAGETGVVVARGLDRARFMACLERARSRQPDVYRIVDGVVLAPAEPGDKPSAAAFADATTLVFVTGADATPTGVRDLLEAGAPLRSSPAFAELFALLDQRRALWFAANGNGKVFDKAAAMGIRPHAVFGSVAVTDGVDATLRVRLATPDAAQQLAAMVQGQVGPVQGFVTRIDVSADDRDLVVALALSPEQVDTLMGLLGLALGTP